MAGVNQPNQGSALGEFVETVRERLAKKEMSLYSLADQAGVGRPYLHRVLAGEQKPTIEWMEKVGKVLGITIKVVVK